MSHHVIEKLLQCLQEHVDTDTSTFSAKEIKEIEPDSLLGRSIVAIKEAQYALENSISSVWMVEDVKEIRPDLSRKKCRAVLEQAENRHDAEVGINWDVLLCHADMLYPERK